MYHECIIIGYYYFMYIPLDLDIYKYLKAPN